MLESALNEILRRHEILRTTFSIAEGDALQIIAPSLDLNLPVVDLSDRSEITREQEARRIINDEAQRPFDLVRGPLLRAQLIRLGEADHVLVLNLHHIVSDGWSMAVLYRELSVIYKALVDAQSFLLPELRVQYADYAVWQRDWLQGEILDRQLSYWKNQLEGIPPVLNLFADRPRPAVQSHRGARASISLSKELLDKLNALSRKENVTLFMTLLAGFQILLRRYTGQDDVVLGSPIAGRNRHELENLIGFFVNTLVLRTNLAANPTFVELLARVRETALGAYAHQDLPFEKLVEEIQPKRNPSFSPLFQVMFVLQYTPDAPLNLEGLDTNPIDVEGESAKFDLTLSIRELTEGLRASLSYNTDLFDGSTIDRMLRHYQILLEEIVRYPGKRILEIPLMTDDERRQLLVEWNETRREYPRDKCIQELFEEQVKQRPEAIAAVFEDQQLSYRELNERANRLGRYLQKAGVEPESLVGICVERSLDMMIGIVAVLKAGAAYVPFDPSYPRERLEFMLEDTRTSVLLTQQRLRGSVTNYDGKILCLDTDWGEIAKESDDNLERHTTASRCQ